MFSAYPAIAKKRMFSQNISVQTCGPAAGSLGCRLTIGERYPKESGSIVPWDHCSGGASFLASIFRTSFREALFQASIFRHPVHIEYLTESDARFLPCSANYFPQKDAICIPARKNEPQWYPFPLKWPTLWHNRRCFELESTNNLPLNSVRIRARYF